ncbi:MAG: hypothetical protein ACYCXP_07265 [Leptospirillum sp.]
MDGYIVKVFMDSVMAFFTAAVAVFTAWMAFETRKLAKEGRDSSDLMELHHQERLAPILNFLPDPGGLHFEWEGNPEGCRFQFAGILLNAGLGPALNVKFIITIPTYPLPITIISSPIGALDKLESHYKEIVDCNLMDCTFLKSNQTTWEMLIEYTDLFGNSYSTKLVHVPNRQDKKSIYNSPEKFFKNRTQ